MLCNRLQGFKFVVWLLVWVWISLSINKLFPVSEAYLKHGRSGCNFKIISVHRINGIRRGHNPLHVSKSDSSASTTADGFANNTAPSKECHADYHQWKNHSNHGATTHLWQTFRHRPKMRSAVYSLPCNCMFTVGFRSKPIEANGSRQ